MRWLVVLLLALSVALAGASTVLAADQERRFIGDECRVAPRPRAEAVALLEGPRIEEPGPLREGVDTVEPAEHRTVEELEVVFRESVTCLFGGDLLRYLALHSDDYLRRLPPDTRAELREVVAGLPEGTPEAAGEVNINVEVADAWLLEDGRVYAVCLVAHKAPQQVVVLRLLFARAGDRWLIDDQDRVTTIDIPE